MNMTVITDSIMAKKLERMLHQCGDLYTLDDLMERINDGRMQSFVQGNTWVITQVNEFPRRKVLEIVAVVGLISDAIQALPQLYEFANKISATLLMASNARDGWWSYAQPGWRKIGSVYAKEL
jgi:hypothetical protein